MDKVLKWPLNFPTKVKQMHLLAKLRLYVEISVPEFTPFAQCSVGNPLPNVFCGRGPNRQDCPSGYFCNIDPVDRFAVCCPQRECI